MVRRTESVGVGWLERISLRRLGMSHNLKSMREVAMQLHGKEPSDK